MIYDHVSIRPVPTDWPLGCQFLGEHQVPLTDGMREALDLFRYSGTDHHLPVHGHTILRSGIVCKQTIP
jgi:hypothetical protein